MKMKTSCIGISLAALAFAASATAGEAHSTIDGYWLCQNIQSSPTATLYVSKLFAANADRGEVTAAYKAMLVAKHGITSQASCSVAYKTTPGIREKLEGDNARWFQQIRSSGGKVVDTGWQYEGETEAAPAAAPVASAAPTATSKNYQCWISGFGGNYMTPAFASSKTAQVLSLDWGAYMTKAHPSERLLRGQCRETDPTQAASNLAQAGRTRVDWQE